MMRRLLRSGLVAMVALPAVLVGAKIAVATIPENDGTVHGCVKSNKIGQLYVIDPGAGQTCGKDTALDWNKTGAPGPKGIDGPKGFTGLQGAAGSSGYEQESASYTSDSSGNGTGEADCSSGKVALAGGFSQSGIGRVAPLESAPKSDGSGWVVGVSGDPNISFTVYAICATNGGS
jgi:hypothetical protein